MRLKDQVAMITGAAQGIGRSIALRMAGEGSDIVITDVNLDRAEETAQDCRDLGVRAGAVKFDVSKGDIFIWRYNAHYQS